MNRNRFGDVFALVWAFVATLGSSVVKREIKPSNKTKEEIAEVSSLRLITPSHACEQS